MNSVPPHLLLSAYLDGELSPSERDEVENLLAESPAARQELDDLERIGDLLRQLPSEAVPNNFAKNILDRNQPARIAIGSTSSPNGSAKRGNRAWSRWISVGTAAAALVVAGLLAFPRSDNSRNELAQKSASPESNPNASLAETDNLPPNERPLAPGDSPLEEPFNEVQLASKSLADERNTRQPANPPLIAKAEAATNRTRVAKADGGEGLALRKDLKNLSTEEMVVALDSQVDRVAVVKLQVADRQQALRDLQLLLHQQKIYQTRTAIPDAAKPGESGKTEAMFAVYVEADAEQMAKALEALQAKGSISQLRVDDPVAVAQVDSLMAPTAPGFRGLQDNGQRPVAASSANIPRDALTKQADKKSKSSHPLADAPANAKSALAGEPTPKPAEAKPQTAPKVAKPESARRSSNAPAASFGAAKTPAALKLPVPEMEKREREAASSVENPATAKETAAQQRKLSVTRDALEKFQQQISQDGAKENADRQVNKNAGPSQRLRVLFVLVDQPEAP